MSIKILITAFGPFQNISINPSQVLLEKLKVDLQSISGIEFTFNVLEVSYRAVDEFFYQLSSTYDWIINMGVASNDRKPRIETIARNQVHGKDIYGFEHLSPIIDSSASDLSTNFPNIIINRILDQFDDEITLSTDAGSYLCNYIYYKSLANFRDNTKVIFIHTADFGQRNDAVDLTRHAAIISALIQEIRTSTNTKLVF